jgi:hypothetical protein
MFLSKEHSVNSPGHVGKKAIVQEDSTNPEPMSGELHSR